MVHGIEETAPLCLKWMAFTRSSPQSKPWGEGELTEFGLEEVVDVAGFEHRFAIDDQAGHLGSAIQGHQFLGIAAVTQGIFHGDFVIDSETLNRSQNHLAKWAFVVVVEV